MSIRARLLALIFSAFLAGCTFYNPLVGRPDPKTMPAELQEISNSLPIRTSWTVNVGESGVYQFRPAYVGNNIFAASANGTIVKVDGKAGNKLWQISANAELTSGVAAADGVVVVTGKKGTVFAYDDNGSPLWSAQASSEILVTPAVGFGLVVVRSIDNKISAFDIQSGVKKWSVDRPLPPLTLRNASGLTITSKFVYVGLPGGRLAALALNNGSIKWEVVVGEPKGATELDRIADVSGKPVLIGDDACAVSFQGRVVCFDASSGAVRWEKKISSEVGMDVDELYAFVSDASGGISAYSRNGGASAWRNDQLNNRHLSAPVSFGRAVAVGDFEGYVHFLSRTDGAFIGRTSTDGSQILAAPIVAGSNLIVQTKSGAVVAIAAE